MHTRSTAASSLFLIYSIFMVLSLSCLFFTLCLLLAFFYLCFVLMHKENLMKSISLIFLSFQHLFILTLESKTQYQDKVILTLQTLTTTITTAITIATVSLLLFK